MDRCPSATQRQLANSLIKSPLEKMLDMLALQVEKSKITFAPKGKTSYQTDLTVQDIATMCGLTQQEQKLNLYSFMSDPHIKIVQDKIFVPDCLELIKQAAFFRKQSTIKAFN